MTSPSPIPPVPPARELGRAFVRLADELQDYRRRVLPRLADGTHWVTDRYSRSS